MKNLILFTSLIFICSCNSTDTDQIPQGTWTGYLSPMNHPEMKNEVSYNIQYVEDELQIELIGPGGNPIQTKSPQVKNDSLFYSFDEPEEGVSLNCTLSKKESGAFEGPCTDPSGKWAYFSMIPPQSH